MNLKISVCRFVCNILIAEDLTLKGKFTYFLSVVKSSKIMTGRFTYMPVDSLVYPKMKLLFAVKTGIPSSQYVSVSTIKLSGRS